MKLRDVTRRLLGNTAQEARQPEKLDKERVDYAYRIFWTKMAREWESERRAKVAHEVRTVMDRPDFEKNPVERRFEVPALKDGLAHSGASLVALSEVLSALATHEAQDTN